MLGSNNSRAKAMLLSGDSSTPLLSFEQLSRWLIYNSGAFFYSNLAMDSTEEAAVLFQIRWLPDPPNPEILPPGFDTAVSGFQGLDAESSSCGATESIKSDDVQISQWSTQFESSQQLVRMPMYTTSDPEDFLSLMGPLSSELTTYLHGKHIAAGPWNPLVAFENSYAMISGRTRYNKSSYASSKLDTSITYYTAKSDIFQSAVSGSGMHVNALMGTPSE
jgi:hypothetical protein